MNFDTRKYVIITFFLITGLMYGIKLFYMQVVEADTWKLEAARIAHKRIEITPPRAVVFDRNGNKVVENKTYYNLMMCEEDMVDLDTVAFGKLVGMTKDEILERIEEIKKGEGKYFNRNIQKWQSNYQRERSYPFLKELTTDEMARIAPKLDRYPGFYKEVTSMRNYPYSSGANILGYLAEVTQEEIDKDKFYKAAYNIGRAGIERNYEKEFRGTKGVRYTIKSALQNTVGAYEDGKLDTTAIQAKGIVLGLDIDLQAYGEKLMQNKKGCIVAIEPSSGEILAMVSAPTYDPNLLVGRKNINEHYPKLVEDPNKPLFPRPLASEYMPGSTFKLIQALIGMQEGVIQHNSGFPCNKSVVGCHNHASARSVTEAVQHSCNPYFYAVTRRIIQQGKHKSSFKDSEVGIDIWADYMHSFGLGVKLKTDIYGLRAGNIPDSKYYDYWRGKGQWKFSAIQSISIGQGEVQLTPLQLANVAQIMANRGWYYTPHFVKSINGGGPRPEYTKKNYTMVDGKYFPYVVEGMRRCVHEPGGTAPMARIPGIITCGKTGTVENFRLVNGRYIKKPNHSVFIAFAPMDNPKIAIAVFVENAGGGGGTWAAPIASLVIEKYLNGEVKSEAKEKRILDAKLSLWE
jgi:penicillin-binding protein 2